jgi:hypothetical protein
MGAGRGEEAERLYYDALVTHPWHGRAARALARIAFDREDHGDRALVWARWAARFNEGEEVSASAMLLGETSLARQEFEDALVAFAVVGEMGSADDPRLAMLIAEALVGLGRVEEALRVLDSARDSGEPTARDEVSEMFRELSGRMDGGDK